MGRQQRELKARTGWLSLLTLPVILGDGGAQGVNSELVLPGGCPGKEVNVAERGCILEGSLAKIQKLQRR